MSQDLKIIQLMQIPPVQHDLNWLKESLQAAIKLEFATIPPYLCARWSIKQATDPVSRSIRVIAREEMLHMALVCNMLTAIGGSPILNNRDAVPLYPDSLPGGVNPNLKVSLQALSKEQVKTFMDIEYPDEGPVALALVSGEEYPTIGAFYSAIETAFEKLQPRLSIEHQLEGTLGLAIFSSQDEVGSALHLIKRQGEGSKASPENTGADDLAHYYRFAEIYHGQKLRKDPPTNQWSFNGGPISFPEVWPMSEVPAGGYQKDTVPDQAVWRLIEEFDQGFTTMLNQLHAAWQSGDTDALSGAVDSMVALKEPAVSLMQEPLPSKTGNYGPCFRLV